jgi:hemolysin D
MFLRGGWRGIHLLCNGLKLKLQPGMEVTVEIKTGKRRLIKFFLSPVLRYGNVSLRERWF